MSAHVSSTRRWLVAIVLAHLVVTIVHGSAHTQAQVPLSTAATVFVFAVIVAGPLVGLALLWPMQRVGTWLIVMTMAGALIFGVVNHFVVASPDHVTHVAAEWRTMFTTTAVLLAVTEGLGVIVGIRAGRRLPG